MAAPLKPALPRFDHWPEAVQFAEHLRGTLVRCGPGFRGAGWPDTPRVRAAALGAWLTPDRIAVRMTAAWVWGACREPGRPLEFSTVGRRRPTHRGTAPDIVLHQFAYAEPELQRLDEGLVVTTPEQTACDLLRVPGPFPLSHRVAVRLLGCMSEGGIETIRERIASGRPQYRATALARLDGAAGPRPPHHRLGGQLVMR